MKKYLLLIVIILIVAIVATFFFYFRSNNSEPENNQAETQVKETKPEPPTTYLKPIEITDGLTYDVLMTENGFSKNISLQILEDIKDVYDLAKIRSDKTLDLVYSINTDEFTGINYKINSEDELIVRHGEEKWAATIQSIPYEIKIKTVEGIIETSMYESGLAQNIDERAIIAFADVLQWSIDFAWEVQKNDSYKFIYEERYLDGEYKMPGKILAGKFINEGENMYGFYYEESIVSPEGLQPRREKNKGYFNEVGESVEKIFLKAPLSFKYISSGFTTGGRYIKAFNISTGHRAIDYAAASGTPVRAVGDGTVSFTGWNGAYGKEISIRHSSVYKTNYCHLSGYAVKSGQKVKQGETIGYVGSTGLSTGPHLHYEMVKNGSKINPFNETLPPSESIKEENLQPSLNSIQDYKDQLDK